MAWYSLPVKIEGHRSQWIEVRKSGKKEVGRTRGHVRSIVRHLSPLLRLRLVDFFFFVLALDLERCFFEDFFVALCLRCRRLSTSLSLLLSALLSLLLPPSLLL